MGSTDPAKPAAMALLQITGASRADAAHLAAALQSHRQRLRLMGMGVPAVCEQLEHVFAAIAVPRSPEVTEGQRGSEVGELPARLDAVIEDAAVVLLGRQQAAKRLGCSLSTLKRRESAGLIRPLRHGRVLRYSPKELDRYMETNTNAAEQ